MQTQTWEPVLVTIIDLLDEDGRVSYTDGSTLRVLDRTGETITVRPVVNGYYTAEAFELHADDVRPVHQHEGLGCAAETCGDGDGWVTH